MENQAWKKVKYLEKFQNAFRGIYVFFKTTRNAPYHLIISIIAILLGFYFHISSTEWIAIIFAVGFVFASEAFNSAIEIDIDLTSPEYHPYARDTKDVAAGAVLIASVTSLVIGLIIFVPKFF